jgi:hypothetical protein
VAFRRDADFAFRYHSTTGANPMKTLIPSLLALAIAALAGPLTAAPVTLTAQLMSKPASLSDLKTADQPLFRRGSDDSGDDDHSGHGGGGHGGGGDDDGDHNGGGHGGDDDDDHGGDDDGDDDNDSGSGRDHPRIPGGSGCDDPFDLIEHPECRV